MRSARTFLVIDSHTAGHPTRVIQAGIPPLSGDSVRARRDDFQARFDALRPALLHEPAGHAAMVGVVMVPSGVAQFGAFFISSYIYLDMCGHATMGLAKTLSVTGAIAPDMPSFTLETPAGIVDVALDWSDQGTLNSVRIRNVPCCAGLSAISLDIPEIGTVSADLAYGGIWYAAVDARAIGLSLTVDNVRTAMHWGSLIKKAITAAIASEPTGLGGGSEPSILFYEAMGPAHGRHLVVLSQDKFDRSPCGTGTSARLALLAAQGMLEPGETYIAENILGQSFRCRFVPAEDTRNREIIPEIEGAAFITALTTIVKEDGDPLAGGFLCR
ncbi:proline racemase [Gluconacetobacter takamatsuzukensis]|uniref:Proline racemase n=2 Tax=Gluconacetobacter takamatsuzukensis TaxID=1286190 RepID=A0A7W4KGA2_9PROT|nr:proline racemase [Gluconacetobacter takamatsuzukensis]